MILFLKQQLPLQDLLHHVEGRLFDRLPGLQLYEVVTPFPFDHFAERTGLRQLESALDESQVLPDSRDESLLPGDGVRHGDTVRQFAAQCVQVSAAQARPDFLAPQPGPLHFLIPHEDRTYAQRHFIEGQHARRIPVRVREHVKPVGVFQYFADIAGFRSEGEGRSADQVPDAGDEPVGSIGEEPGGFDFQGIRRAADGFSQAALERPGTKLSRPFLQRAEGLLPGKGLQQDMPRADLFFAVPDRGLFHLDDVPAVQRLHRFRDGSGRRCEGHRFEFRDHGVSSEEPQVAPLGGVGRVLREVPGQRLEISAAGELSVQLVDLAFHALGIGHARLLRNHDVGQRYPRVLHKRLGMIPVVRRDVAVGDRIRFHFLVFRIEKEVFGGQLLVLIHESLPDFQVRDAGARHHPVYELLPGQQQAELVFEIGPAFDGRIVQCLEVLGLVEFAVRLEYLLLPDVFRRVRANRLQNLGVGYGDALLTDVLFEQREVYPAVPDLVYDLPVPEFVHAAALLLAVDLLLPFHFEPYFLIGHRFAVDRSHGVLSTRPPARHVGAPFQADQSHEGNDQDYHDDVGSLSQQFHQGHRANAPCGLAPYVTPACFRTNRKRQVNIRDPVFAGNSFVPDGPDRG